MKDDLIQILPSNASWLWHSWMNKQSDLLKKDGSLIPSTIYEFKNMLSWLAYGHLKIAEAFQGNLPKVHRQCSMSPKEEVKEPKLTCAIGKDVLQCEILASLKAECEAYAQRPTGNDPFTDKEMYRLMSATCAFHVLHEATGMTRKLRLDTSEGYMQDTSDRMFWDRVYESMATPLPDVDEDPTHA